MYKVELSESEVKSIGERRWFRKCWRRVISVIGIPLLVAFVVVATIPKGEFGASPVLLWAVIVPLLVLSVVAYFIYVRKVIKSGKAFLQLNKKVSAEDLGGKGWIA